MDKLEKVARAIADQNGDQWEFVPEDKSDWIDNRGMFQGRSRDINEPFRCDYEEMATAALNAVYSEQKPLIDMIKGVLDEGYYPDNPIWDEVRAALSALSSPLGKGERQPVDNKNSGGNV